MNLVVYYLCRHSPEEVPCIIKDVIHSLLFGNSHVTKFIETSCKFSSFINAFKRIKFLFYVFFVISADQVVFKMRVYPYHYSLSHVVKLHIRNNRTAIGIVCIHGIIWSLFKIHYVVTYTLDVFFYQSIWVFHFLFSFILFAYISCNAIKSFLQWYQSPFVIGFVL